MRVQDFLVNPLLLSDDERHRLGLDSPSNDNSALPLLVTVRQAGSLLGVGKTQVFNLLRLGVLERRKVGGATRVTLRSVRDLAGV